MDTLKKIYAGTLTNVNATLYTVPNTTPDNITVVGTIILSNKTASAVTGTIKVAGIQIVPAKSIPANDSIILSQLGIVLNEGDLIEGLAGANTSIDVYIGGMEVV